VLNSSDNEKLLINNILSVSSSQSQLKYQSNHIDSHKEENGHNNNTEKDEESNNEKLISNLQSKIKNELEEQEKE
jgi:hypothetical protein